MKPVQVSFLEQEPSMKFTTIDEYIATFPKETQKILKDIRATIKAAAPDAEEKISYQMPTFFLKGNLIHFAAYKNHIGIYPTPNGIESFKKELSKYKGAKAMALVFLRMQKALPLGRSAVSHVISCPECACL